MAKVSDEGAGRVGRGGASGTGGGRRSGMPGASGASPRFRELAGLDREGLRRAMEVGSPVWPGEVAGRVFRGWNLNPLTGVVRQRKFLKRIHPPGPNGEVRGENVLARQNGLDEAWLPRLDGRGILPFSLLGPGAGATAGWPRALVVSYGAWPGRSPFNPMSRVVDYVVRPDATRPDLMLGASYLDLRTFRLLLEHFVLEAV